MKTFPFTTVLLALAALLASTPIAAPWLQYDRAAILAGQWWRILTSQFTHWTPIHLVWDIAVFIVFAAVCERRSRAALLAVAIGSALAVPLVIHFVEPRILYFRGLSGIDSALFGFIATDMIIQAIAQPPRNALVYLGAAAWMGFFTKTIHELISGTPVFVSEMGGAIVVPSAHLAGFAIGVMAAGAIGLQSRRRRQSGAAAHRFASLGAMAAATVRAITAAPPRSG